MNRLRKRWLGRVIAGLAVTTLMLVIVFNHWVDRTELPNLKPEVSVTIVDREGRLMRAYQVADGRWRLPVAPDEVDRGYIAQLLAYEDKRFYRHNGVDVLALLRAVGQAVWHGRVVSGASTLTMQVARLLEERPTVTLSAKLRQMRLALALERRRTKTEILHLYLTLAPFGGNLEGIRAASFAYLGKEPTRLTPAEAALLVALPQAPEVRRPDRNHFNAKAARNMVLDRVAEVGVIRQGDVRAGKTEAVPRTRRAFPMHSPHLADRTVKVGDAALTHRLTLDLDLQKSLETLIRERATGLRHPVSAAIVVADHQSGEVLASIGSAGIFDQKRDGWIDMTQAVRSPGSTLKPLIYGLAFEQGVAHPESLIDDRPTRFGTYTPTNFDDGYHGKVSVRTALQRSLNVPAVALLDAVGPARLMARMRSAGGAGVLPPGRAPGLAIGLGGIGLTLNDLVTIYAGIARGGEAVQLRTNANGSKGEHRFLSKGAAWQVADILAGAPAPVAATNHQLAFKTGTSYGHRDAWAVGFDGRHVIGVWMGRPDAAPVPGITGIKDAAPLLFEAFSRLKRSPDRLPPPPRDVLTVAHADLPEPLRHVRLARGVLESRHAPELVFPPSGARVDLELDAGPSDLVLKIRRGAPPFTWLVDGRPVETGGFEREIAWRPDGPGHVSIAVIDAAGSTARTKIYLE